MAVCNLAVMFAIAQQRHAVRRRGDVERNSSILFAALRTVLRCTPQCRDFNRGCIIEPTELYGETR